MRIFAAVTLPLLIVFSPLRPAHAMLGFRTATENCELAARAFFTAMEKKDATAAEAQTQGTLNDLRHFRDGLYKTQMISANRGAKRQSAVKGNDASSFSKQSKIAGRLDNILRADPSSVLAYTLEGDDQIATFMKQFEGKNLGLLNTRGIAPAAGHLATLSESIVIFYLATMLISTKLGYYPFGAAWWTQVAVSLLPTVASFREYQSGARTFAAHQPDSPEGRGEPSWNYFSTDAHFRGVDLERFRNSPESPPSSERIAPISRQVFAMLDPVIGRRLMQIFYSKFHLSSFDALYEKTAEGKTRLHLVFRTESNN